MANDPKEVEACVNAVRYVDAIYLKHHGISASLVSPDIVRDRVYQVLAGMFLPASVRDVMHHGIIISTAVALGMTITYPSIGDFPERTVDWKERNKKTFSKG
jgi:hypothetical protein